MVDQGRCNYNFTQSFTTEEKGDTILCDWILGEDFSLFDISRRLAFHCKTRLSHRVWRLLWQATLLCHDLLEMLWVNSRSFRMWLRDRVIGSSYVMARHQGPGWRVPKLHYCENLKVLNFSHVIPICWFFHSPVMYRRTRWLKIKKCPSLACGSLVTPRLC
jgi:hypothetical protein